MKIGENTFDSFDLCIFVFNAIGKIADINYIEFLVCFIGFVISGY